MAKFTIKALVVTALVCLVFDCSRATDTQQPQQTLDSLQEAAKGKMTEFMNSFKQTASETYNKMQDAVKESENTKKVESQLSNFFTGAFAKLKNTFSSTKTTNPDDLTKQEAIKAFDDYALAASDNSQQHQQNEDVHQQTVGYVDKDTSSETTPTPSTFKDKFKGFVSSVKEGASEALDKLDEKRKEAVAGTKKLVNGAIDKIKHSYDSIKNGNSEENAPRSPESSSEEHVKTAAKDAKDAVIDKTQNFMKSEKTN